MPVNPDQTYTFSSEVQKRDTLDRWMQTDEEIDTNDTSLFGPWIDTGAFDQVSVLVADVSGDHANHVFDFHGALAPTSVAAEFEVLFTGATGLLTVANETQGYRFFRWDLSTPEGTASRVKMTMFFH